MEVACGTPPNRRAIVPMLAELESAPLATSDELLELIERRSLYGRGCGLVDISLLASTLLSEKTLLWTADIFIIFDVIEYAQVWTVGAVTQPAQLFAAACDLHF